MESGAYAYTAWIERVKAVVPPERLLIFQAKDGYKPLCKFLGIESNPVCAQKFPHINDTASLKAKFGMTRFVADNWVAIAIVGALLLAMIAMLIVKFVRWIASCLGLTSAPHTS